MKQLSMFSQEIDYSHYHNKNIVVTGRLQIKRREIKKIVKNKLKAKLLSAVTKNTDILIVGLLTKECTVKLAKAKEMNIEVINGLTTDLFSC